MGIMNISIEIICPHSHNAKRTKNGKKSNGKQNYLCKTCGRQFISDHEKTYWYGDQALETLR